MSARIVEIGERQHLVRMTGMLPSYRSTRCPAPKALADQYTGTAGQPAIDLGHHPGQ